MNGGHTAQIERGAQFQSLIQRAEAALGVARELKDEAEATVDILVGPNGKGPQLPRDEKPAAPAPRATVNEVLGMLIDRIHSEIGETTGHLNRLLRELPPQPDRGPATR